MSRNLSQVLLSYKKYRLAEETYILDMIGIWRRMLETAVESSLFLVSQCSIAS